MRAATPHLTLKCMGRSRCTARGPRGPWPVAMPPTGPRAAWCSRRAHVLTDPGGACLRPPACRSRVSNANCPSALYHTPFGASISGGVHGGLAQGAVWSISRAAPGCPHPTMRAPRRHRDTLHVAPVTCHPPTSCTSDVACDILRATSASKIRASQSMASSNRKVCQTARPPPLRRSIVDGGTVAAAASGTEPLVACVVRKATRATYAAPAAAVTFRWPEPSSAAQHVARRARAAVPGINRHPPGRRSGRRCSSRRRPGCHRPSHRRPGRRRKCRRWCAARDGAARGDTTGVCPHPLRMKWAAAAWLGRGEGSGGGKLNLVPEVAHHGY